MVIRYTETNQLPFRKSRRVEIWRRAHCNSNYSHAPQPEHGTAPPSCQLSVILSSSSGTNEQIEVDLPRHKLCLTLLSSLVAGISLQEDHDVGNADRHPPGQVFSNEGCLEQDLRAFVLPVYLKYIDILQ